MTEKHTREVLPATKEGNILERGKGLVSIDTGTPVVIDPPSSEQQAPQQVQSDSDGASTDSGQ